LRDGVEISKHPCHVTCSKLETDICTCLGRAHFISWASMSNSAQAQFCEPKSQKRKSFFPLKDLPLILRVLIQSLVIIVTDIKI